MFLDLKDKALTITVREGVCICGGSQVAFTQYGNYLNLYLDGKLIRREPFQTYVGFRADETAVGLSYFGKEKKASPSSMKWRFFKPDSVLTKSKHCETRKPDSKVF